MVEWISALDGAIQRIVKVLAGVEDEPPAAHHVSSSDRSRGSGGAGGAPSNEWIKQLERNFENMSTSTHGGGEFEVLCGAVG